MKNFTVSHTKDWNLNTELHFNTDDYRPLRENYKPVALVTCEGVGATFHLTNHIDKEWWENDGVKVLGVGRYDEPKHRSTSVGDIVRDEETLKLYLCCSIGWKELNGWNVDKYRVI